MLMKTASGRWLPFLVTAELRGLIWPNVDLDKRVIHLCQCADAWGTIGKPKSKALNRDIPLVPVVVNTLREWRAACPQSALELVFPNGRGNVESHTSIIRLQIAAGMTVDANGKGGDGHLYRRPNTAFTPFDTPPPACSSPTWAGRRSASRR